MNRMKKLWRDQSILFLSIPYLFMMLGLGIRLSVVHYFRGEMVAPHILFSAGWITCFLVIAAVLPRLYGRIVYGLLTSASIVFCIGNIISLGYTGYCISFNLIQMAGEGKGYLLDIALNAGLPVYLLLFVTILTMVLGIVRFPKERLKGRTCLTVLLGWAVLHTCIPFLYGPLKSSLHWDAWRNPRNVYAEFNDKNKSLKVSGLWEYTFRDFYITFLKPEEKQTAEESAFLQQVFADESEASPNAYTGMFRGRNVIFLQLEGIDSWLLTKETMPNLFALREQSIDFTDHYSFYNGGGSTFNSEFAVNTGYITPFSYAKNAYLFNNNAFPYSMPRMFGALGYSVNAFHMNSGSFYSREINYSAWGYEAYHGLRDEVSYEPVLYELDRTLLTEPSYRKLLFRTDCPTVSYLITYTPHTPFTTNDGVGAYLAKERFGKAVSLSEEETAKLFASETDRMIGLLMEGLRDSGLYEKTVLVVYADHYLYTLEDKSILDRYKTTDNNLINQTPFFIWSGDTSYVAVTKANSQIDILPTVLNLFGISYCPLHYVGSDILSPDYEGYVVFPDSSVYNGEVYVENGRVTQVGADGSTDVDALCKKVNRMIRKNDLVLRFDYFRTKGY